MILVVVQLLDSAIHGEDDLGLFSAEFERDEQLTAKLVHAAQRGCPNCERDVKGNLSILVRIVVAEGFHFVLTIDECAIKQDRLLDICLSDVFVGDAARPRVGYLLVVAIFIFLLK